MGRLMGLRFVIMDQMSRFATSVERLSLIGLALLPVPLILNALTVEMG